MFQGFSQETLAFFAALKFNNNREFFEENRKVYDEAVREPLIALTEALAPTVLKIDPLLDIRPARVVARIHRDLRFRKDKTPYREYMWLGFRRVGESREETCGFYFDLSSDSANWGCGYYNMQAETMQHFRTMLRENPKHVLNVIRKPAFKSRYELMGERYVRQHQPPEGMDPLLGTLYQKKSIYAEHHVEDMTELFSPELVDQIAADFEVLAPFYNLMRECMVKRIETEADG